MLILSNTIASFLLFIFSLFTPYTVLSETEELIEKDNVSFIQNHEDDNQLQEEIFFETEEENLEDYKGKYRVDFHFVDYNTLNDKSLPDDVMKLLEDSIYVDSIEEIKLPEYSKSESGYMFYKWEGGISLDDKKITYIGVWFKIPNTSLRSIPYPGTPADAIAGSQYPVAMGGTISGEVMHQTLNGSEAICVEPDVRTYALANTGFWQTGSIDSRIAEIIWLGSRNGASWGAIQAAVWNHMYGYNKYSYGFENVDPNSSTFNSNGAYVCSGPYYETQDYGGTTTIQSLTNIDEVACRLVTTNGKINIKKIAASNSIDYMLLFTNNYSLGSAKYGLYTDKECNNQIGTFITDNSGISNSITVNTGTYYVKEIEASKGFKLDTTVYKAQVSTNKTTTIQSIENPQIGRIKLNKKTNDNQLLVNYPEYYSLANAEYNIYTDKDCTNKIKTITTKADGSSDVVELPIGTYYIKEAKASNGFKLDEKTYSFTIKDNDYITIESIEEAFYGEIQINKKAKDTKLDFINDFPNNYTLKDAKYEIYTDEDCLELFDSLTTNKQGLSQILKLPVGTYYIKETIASKGFRLDEKTYKVIVEDESFNSVESIEDPIYNPTLITLYKQNIKDKEKIKYLDEVRFVLKYYDSNEKTLSEKDLKYTWIFKAIMNNNEAEIIFDKKHYVGGDELLLDDDDNLKLPLGSFTIEEIIAPQTYARDENIYYGQIIDEYGQAKIIFNDGEWIKQEKQNEKVLFMAANNTNDVLKLKQMERQVILKTTAIFEESGNDQYVADGIAHIKDIVEYDFLKNNHEYILKAKLINKKDESVIMEEKTIFKADNSNTTSISFKINLDNYDSSDFVVYEYLYDKDNPDVLIAKHEDKNDEDQTVHVNKLYKAQMILYKIGGSKGIKLNGAIFEIKTKRTKRDGTLVEKNLGKFISGGIFVERQDSFTFKLAMDKNMQIVIDTIDSSLHHRFNSQCVTILGLDEGVYYGQINDEEIIEYEIVKGMIKLKDQEENTEITYTELIAPAGYYMDDKPYIVNVGNDDSLAIIENYRKNNAMIIPKTGI